MPRYRTMILLGLALAASAPTLAATDAEAPQAAVAILHGTQAYPEASATIRFRPTDNGLAYTTDAQGLPPGQHGYHIHLYGDCSAADGSSAGTHFNLQGSSTNPPPDIDRITGDLGNLDVADDGTAHDSGRLENGQLSGAKSIIGRGVIIHAKPNDPAQPPIGAAGARQACGVIGAAAADQAS
ncbi:superoxide dismutase family protein [Salinisphaera sp. SPP-AMP-43]|uniref:superoxide dismutase family protein n=1 Tax=Salinisphaera sp. SPP-AMP-43 TaxID=3121288 RepID=UPI003C6E7F63